MRISDWSSDVCSSDLSQALSTEERRPSAQRRAGASGLASLSFRRAFPLPSLPFRHGLGLIKAKTQRIHNGVAHHRRGHGEQDQPADKRSGPNAREKIERRRGRSETRWGGKGWGSTG